jgi:hypothetical protein
MRAYLYALFTEKNAKVATNFGSVGLKPLLISKMASNKFDNLFFVSSLN